MNSSSEYVPSATPSNQAMSPDNSCLRINASQISLISQTSSPFMKPHFNYENFSAKPKYRLNREDENKRADMNLQVNKFYHQILSPVAGQKENARHRKTISQQVGIKDYSLLEGLNNKIKKLEVCTKRDVI